VPGPAREALASSHNGIALAYARRLMDELAQTTGAAPARSAAEAHWRARSLWLEGLPGVLEPRPPLSGEQSADVAIVGAGLSGLWSAYYLKREQPDLDVIVVEREIAGFGPSGRNGGWVRGGMSGVAKRYARRSGWDAVRRAERDTVNAVDVIGEVVAEEGIDCGFNKQGDVVLAENGTQLGRLRADLADARSLGLEERDMRLLSAAEVQEFVRVPDCAGGLYDAGAARVDPAALTRGLAEACERRGVRIHEQSAALEVSPGIVSTAGGTVRARSVLRCTESYTVQLAGARREFLPLYSLMIATEPLPEPVWDEIGWRDGLLIKDRRHLFFYAQRTRDDRIAIGGRGAPYRLGAPVSEHSERSEEVRARLVAAIARCFPAAASAAITHHWGGPLAVPRDWCMAVNYDRATGLGSTGGYSGHGVLAAHVGGRTLADLVLGRDSERTRAPWVGHHSRRWEPEPLRFLASRSIIATLGSADRIEVRTGRPARRVRLVDPFMPPR
jgi:glycine/D-amino acid oxidase-like deaminating enzyme